MPLVGIMGETPSLEELFDCPVRKIDPTAFEDFLRVASSAQLRFVTLEARELEVLPTDRLIARPPTSTMARVTRFLYERYQTFSGQRSRGLILLPLDCADGNALKAALERQAEAWMLDDPYMRWLRENNAFCGGLLEDGRWEVRIPKGFEAPPIREGRDVVFSEAD